MSIYDFTLDFYPFTVQSMNIPIQHRENDNHAIFDISVHTLFFTITI